MKIDFEQLGFSNAESEVFAQLLKQNQLSATEIVNKVKISASNTYLAIEKLIQKGIITKVSINTRPVYKINHEQTITALQESLDEEYNEKKQLTTQLQTVLQQTQAPQANRDAEIYIGITNLRSAYRNLFSENDKEYVFFYNYELTTGQIVHDFFTKMDVANYYKNIPTRALFNTAYKPLFKQRKNAQFKAKFTNYPIPSSINIYGNKVLIIHWSVEPVAFILTSEEIAQNFREMFEGIWKLQQLMH